MYLALLLMNLLWNHPLLNLDDQTPTEKKDPIHKKEALVGQNCKRYGGKSVHPSKETCLVCEDILHICYMIPYKFKGTILPL